MKTFLSNSIASEPHSGQKALFIQKKADSFFSSNKIDPPFFQPITDRPKISSEGSPSPSLNRKIKPSMLSTGKKMIQMSSDVGTYAVESGDTFKTVASKLSITVPQLIALNSKKYKYSAKNNQVTNLSGGVVKLAEGIVLKVPNTAKLKVGNGDTGKLEYVQVSGQAFIKGGSDGHVVDPNDVDQGDLNDCSLMSGMAAIAKASPSTIYQLIKKLGKGKYAVTLYVDSGGFFNYKVKHTETVSDFFPGTDGSPEYGQTSGDTKESVQEIWPMLLEKALAQYLGGYDKIESRGAGDMMEYLTGKESKSFEVTKYSETILAFVIKGAITENRAITASSKDKIPESLKSKNIVADHSYAPMKVNSGRTLDLYNPHGHTHLNNFAIADFKKGFNYIQIMDK